MRPKFACLLGFQVIAAVSAASAHADTFTSCLSERGFSYRDESGYASDNPYILLKSDASSTKHFLIYEVPALAKTEIMGVPPNITGIRVNKTTFDWLDTVEAKYKNVQITFGVVTGTQGFVSISSTPTDKCH